MSCDLLRHLPSFTRPRFSVTRFAAACLIGTAILLAGENASARIVTEDYKDATLADLTRFAAHYKTIDLANLEIFKEYLQITECAIFSKVHNSTFKQQEVQQLFMKNLELQRQQDREIYLRIPVSFRISGYNFDTQSFPVIRNSQFIKVNFLELNPRQERICNNAFSADLAKIPTTYYARLNMPISLYRIPIQRDIAESVASRLRAQGNSEVQTLYGYILLQVEAIQPEIQVSDVFPRVVVRGNVMAIDLYMDKDRQIMFKRLDYHENF